MESLTPAEICAGVLAVASAIVLLANAAEKIGKVIQAAKAPNAEQNEKIADHETRIAKLERHQENDKRELDAIREYNRISALAQIALLDHGLDGNNIKPMQDAKDELNHWLARK